MSKRSMIGISNISQNHWHPCCQEKPDMPIDNTRKLMKINSNIPTRGKQNTVNRTENIYYMDTVGWSEASEDVEPKSYVCPRGHTFQSKNPLVIAVESNPEYNSGPICGYCLVDWHRNNVNAEFSDSPG